MAACPQREPSSPSVEAHNDDIDHVLMRHVLRLPEDDNEALYDLRLTQEALQLGLDIPPPPSPLASVTSRKESPTRTPALARDRRSISTDSSASKSSRPLSDVSKSWERSSSNGFTSLEIQARRSSVTSTSSQSHDSVLSQPIPVLKSTVTPGLVRQSPDGPFSSSPHRHLIRGLTKLRLRRHDSDKANRRCPHCLTDSDAAQTNLYRLPCHHRFCAAGLIHLIRQARIDSPTSWPTCCDVHIPRTYVHLVDVDSPKSERRGVGPGQVKRLLSESEADTIPDQGVNNRERQSEEDIEVDRNDHGDLVMENLSKAMLVPEFAALRAAQAQEMDRLSRFDMRRRADLIDTSRRRRETSIAEFSKLREALSEKQADVLADVEDKHILAEADLRQVHDTERRNMQTALKHMEAFCRGESTNGEPHHRTVTEQDRHELRKIQRLRDNIDVRHESAINVLRGEQAQRLKLRIRRHESEIDQLDRRRERELDRLVAELDFDLREWSLKILHKRSALERWWKMQNQICLKRHGQIADSQHDDALPPLSWATPRNSHDQGDETVHKSLADMPGDSDGELASGKRDSFIPATGVSAACPASPQALPGAAQSAL